MGNGWRNIVLKYEALVLLCLQLLSTYTWLAKPRPYGKLRIRRIVALVNTHQSLCCIFLHLTQNICNIFPWDATWERIQCPVYISPYIMAQQSTVS
jgi:hypothetical protein